MQTTDFGAFNSYFTPLFVCCHNTFIIFANQIYYLMSLMFADKPFSNFFYFFVCDF